MKTKDLQVGGEYAWTPCYSNAPALHGAHWFRVRLIGLNVSALHQTWHRVEHLDDLSGERLYHADGMPRFYDVPAAELRRPWAEYVAEVHPSKPVGTVA